MRLITTVLVALITNISAGRADELRGMPTPTNANVPYGSDSRNVLDFWAASVSVGQTSIDPKVIEGWLGPNVLKHPMISFAVGESDISEVILQALLSR